MEETCMIVTPKDVKGLCKILKKQVRCFGPFTITFNFDDEVEG